MCSLWSALLRTELRVYKGGGGCTTTTPCSAGEGDCDKDSECKGSYKCFQRGKNGANPPGVVLSADGSADITASEALRNKMSVVVF